MFTQWNEMGLSLFSPPFCKSFLFIFYLFSCGRFIILVCSLNELDVFPWHKLREGKQTQIGTLTHHYQRSNSDQMDHLGLSIPALVRNDPSLSVLLAHPLSSSSSSPWEKVALQISKFHNPWLSSVLDQANPKLYEPQWPRSSFSAYFCMGIRNFIITNPHPES